MSTGTGIFIKTKCRYLFRKIRHGGPTCVPVKEGLPPEHGGELLGDPLEELLNGRRVACNKQNSYLLPTG